MASKLPEDVWALILQHVPQSDRLKHCALVWQKLSSAAAAATDTLQLSLRNRSPEQLQQLAEAFNSYLQHHGSHVTSLVLDNADQPLTQLPCPQLLHLDISLADPLQLGLQNGLPGVLDSCATALTSLKLRSCTVAPDGGSLSRLSVLAALRHLEVQYVRQPDGVYATLPGSVLPSLAHLTRLQLSVMGGVEDVHHVSSLTNLSVLRIKHVEGPQPLRLAPDIAPGFVLPASLKQLRLGDGVVLDPAVLAAATQLTSVELGILGAKVQGGRVSSGAALLAAVVGLQGLVTLELTSLRGVGWPAPCAAYASLTASSKLQRLLVLDCGLPAGVWEHVFPPAHSCPALREFAVSGGDFNCWSAEAVSSLVRSCPGLQNLRMNLCGDPAVAALESLTALSALELSVDCTHDQAGVGVSVAHIAALTSLQRLRLFMSVRGEAETAALSGTAVLLPFTALRGLTFCKASLLSSGNGERKTLGSVYASNKAGPEQPPDAWLQVLEQCLKASNGWSDVIAVAKQQAQRAAEQEQLNEELQQQNAALQQQIAALQAQVHQLEQQQQQP